jgi:hypothetical protein
MIETDVVAVLNRMDTRCCFATTIGATKRHFVSCWHHVDLERGLRRGWLLSFFGFFLNFILFLYTAVSSASSSSSSISTQIYSRDDIKEGIQTYRGRKVVLVL